jgi:hypothetical protein
MRLNPRAAARLIECGLPAATQSGGCGGLRRGRLDDNVLEMPEATLVREALPRRPASPHDFEGFLETRFGFFGRDLKSFELAVAISLADAEIEPALREKIERCRFLGEQHRVVPRRHDDGRTETKRLRAHGQSGEQHQCRGNLIPATEMVFNRETRMKAERLGFDIEIEKLKKTLARFPGQIRADPPSANRTNRNAFLEPRDVREWQFPGMNMQAAEFSAAVELRENLAGVKQPFAIERTFYTLLLVEIGFGEHRVHQIALFDTNAVFAGENTADLHAQFQNFGAEFLGLLEFTRLVRIVKNEGCRLPSPA